MNPKKIRLLIVDDDEVDREMIRKSLAILDADIDEVTNCADLMKTVAEEDKYDLILLDYKLPDDTGLNAASRLRTSGNNTPMILITGFGSEALEREAITRGMLGYIAKDKVTAEVIIKIILGAFTKYKTTIEKAMTTSKESIERLDDINKILKEKIDYYTNLKKKK